ncbi:MAG TPA: glycosyltransferase family 2 protein [Methylomirabilota bacterium]|jgi:glycosyltransferase involved in cell wall biosynthesis|nr:glycosyltransferase family 2 protein [Methylomirabilota bacterium]
MISIVLPVYDEAENLPILWAELEPVLKTLGSPCEVLIVDDGSTDGSADIARALARSDQRIRLVRLGANTGLTAALLAGFALAQGTIIVTMDADLQYDPADIPRLVSLLDRYDAALGWRAHRHDGWTKRLSSRIANRVRNAVLGDAFRDSGCTLRAMRRACLAAIAPYHGLHRFVPILLALAGCRVIEVEVRHRPRQHGVSKYGIRNRSLPALLDLLAVRWMRARRVAYTIVEDTRQDT